MSPAIPDRASFAETFADGFRRGLAALEERQPRPLPRADVPDGFRRSAVLLPFWREGDGVRVLLTERARSLRSHGGEVSFPGGHVDSADESDRAAALREAREEIGLDPRAVQIAVALDEAWSGARNVIQPFAAWLDAPPRIEANPAEVARVLIADVEPMMVPGARERHVVVVGSQEFVNYAYRGEWGRVIGLSADLLLEALLRVSGQSCDRAEVRLDELRRYQSIPDAERIRG